MCKSYSHTVTLSVDMASANVSVGQDVGPNVTAMLRAYTTYFITVVAESDELGTSGGCDHIILTTPQTSMYNKPTKITVTGLTTYTTYSIQVAVVNMQGDVGPYGDHTEAQTAEASKC